MMAMHGPEGQYKDVPESEVEGLKKQGWVDGHEYWTAVNAGKDPFAKLPSAADLDKVAEEQKVAEATAPKKRTKRG